MRAAVVVAGAAVAACLAAGVVLVTNDDTSPAPTSSAAAGVATTEVAPALVGRPRGTPDRDDFYQPPATLDGKPGELLRYRQSQVFTDTKGGGPAPVQSWQVLYRSTGARGEPNAVSGTVLMPRSPWTGTGPRPIVSFAVGTHGLADRCAPSYKLATGTEGEGGQLARALMRGWAVTVTDYEGLGTPGDHTYGVHRSEGHAVLDVVRAAMRVPGSGLAADAPVGLWGYSQGGGAATSAAERAADYAPELKTVGVAAGGAPADLAAVARHLDGSATFGLVGAGTVGLNAAYPELKIRESLNPRGRLLFDLARNACAADLFNRRLSGRRISEFSAGGDPFEFQPLLDRLAENRVGSAAPAMPVRIYHGQRDEYIPFAVGRTLFDDYCRQGVRVQFQAFPRRNHGGAAQDGAPPTIDWLADRFAGRPAPNSCA